MSQPSWGDLPTEMHIGPVRVAPNAILAPMEGVTDLTFRRLIRGIGGCGLTVTEFVPAKGLSQKIQRARLMAEFDPDERPIAIQIYGNEPAIMARGASIVQELGADILDVNMGCPSKRVCNRWRRR